MLSIYLVLRIVGLSSLDKILNFILSFKFFLIKLKNSFLPPARDMKLIFLQNDERWLAIAAAPPKYSSFRSCFITK